jgi:predicted GIY-YIG superfamily endonuclease
MTDATAWQVYILECADSSLYTGITTDLQSRLASHNDGSGAKYTRGRLPVRAVYAESAADRGSALRRELEIKGLSRTAKLELIKVKACQTAAD